MRLPQLVKTQPDAFKELSRPELRKLFRAASDIVNSMQSLTAQHSQIVDTLIDGQPFIEWQHYPEDDVRDKRNKSQYFYHAHTGKQRPFSEHGHFHLFVHAQELGLRRPHPKHSEAPAHLIALSMDAHGMPTGFFAVNRWVTKGPWLSYRDCEIALDNFAVRGRQGNPDINRFLTALVVFYRPAILEVIKKRDQIMARLTEQNDIRRVFADQTIEVLCYRPINLLSDIENLENSVS